ncbi:unnamed protein product [Symbiodinium sp. CCMP2592]|nr:unnamed protein product [Symbiodinium sp. CCMP2592]
MARAAPALAPARQTAVNGLGHVAGCAQVAASVGKTAAFSLGAFNPFAVLPGLAWVDYAALLGVQSVFREKDSASGLKYILQVYLVLGRGTAQFVYGHTVVPLGRGAAYVLTYIGVPCTFEFQPMSVIEELTKLSRSFLFGDKECQLQKAQKSIDELKLEAAAAERRVVQERDIYEKKLSEQQEKVAALESNLAGANQLSAELTPELVRFHVVTVENSFLKQAIARLEKKDIPLLRQDNARLKEDMRSLHQQTALLTEDNLWLKEDSVKRGANSLRLRAKYRQALRSKKAVTVENTFLKQATARLEKKDIPMLRQDNARLKEDIRSLRQQTALLTEDNLCLKEDSVKWGANSSRLRAKYRQALRSEKAVTVENTFLKQATARLEKKDIPLLRQDNARLKEDIRSLRQQTALLTEDNLCLKEDSVKWGANSSRLRAKYRQALRSEKAVTVENTFLKQATARLEKKDIPLLRQDNARLKEDIRSLRQQTALLTEDNLCLKEDSVKWGANSSRLRAKYRQALRSEKAVTVENTFLKQATARLEKKDIPLLRQDNARLKEDTRSLRQQTALLTEDNAKLKSDIALLSEDDAKPIQDSSPANRDVQNSNVNPMSFAEQMDLALRLSRTADAEELEEASKAAKPATAPAEEAAEVVLRESSAGEEISLQGQLRHNCEQIALKLTRADWLLLYEGVALEAQLRARTVAYQLRQRQPDAKGAVQLFDLEAVLLQLPIFGARGSSPEGAVAAASAACAEAGLATGGGEDSSLRDFLQTWEDFDGWASSLEEHLGPLDLEVSRERSNNLQKGQSHTPYVLDLCRLAFRNFAICEGRLFISLALALYSLIARTLRDDPERNPSEDFKERSGGGEEHSQRLALLEALHGLTLAFAVQDDALALQRSTLEEYRYYLLEPLSRVCQHFDLLEEN